MRKSPTKLSHLSLAKALTAAADKEHDAFKGVQVFARHSFEPFSITAARLGLDHDAVAAYREAADRLAALKDEARRRVGEMPFDSMRMFANALSSMHYRTAA